MSIKPIRAQARQMLDMVQLGDFVDAYPHQLSGGMQQRAALARALMSDPDILLLDEPFGALDELTREVLNEELIRIWQSNATRLETIIMVTHSISEAVTMSDRVIVLTDRPARLVKDVQVGCPPTSRAGRPGSGCCDETHPGDGERPADDVTYSSTADYSPCLRLPPGRRFVMVADIPEYLLPAPSAIVANVDRTLAVQLRGNIRRGADRLPDCQRVGIRLRHYVRSISYA